jgi:F-type H+-transporting ATPase subunit epsilon
MTFNLVIVSPDGLIFEGEVLELSLRSIDGDVGIMARHADFLTAIGMGECRIVTPDENVRSAACIGGFLSVIKGEARVVATTFEWAEDIDPERARDAKERAESAIKIAPDSEKNVAKARLKRAVVRLGVASNGGSQ